jgi:hypothetical protein
MDYAQAREAFFQPRPDDAPPAGTSGWTSTARALRDAIEPIATICYWSEPAYDAYCAKGLDFLTGYVWGRACVLGEPEATVVASAFGVFEPGLIASLYDAGRAACSLADVRSAKESGAVAALQHVLSGIEEVEAVVAVLQRAVAAADPTGRALHSGLAALPWPQEPLGRLWHACAVLREHRGDGHLAACVAAGLSGLEANLLTEAQVGWTPFSYTGSRGWSPEAMTEASARLAERRLLADGALTQTGTQLRDSLERTTDATVAAAVAAAGPELSDAVAALDEWSQRIVDAGWFPPDPYKRASG